jgi:UDP:flavonoid glycosyltransferase YjiC (YdhE family)
MLKSMICLLTLSSSLLAQNRPSDETIKKDVQTLQSAANDVVGGIVSGLGVLQAARGTFLDGYGIVVTMEVALEPPRNPFTAMKTSNDVVTTVNQKRKATVEKLTSLLKEKTPTLASIGPTESATFIVYLLNANPGDLPDLPAQLVLTVKKQDAAAGTVNLHEYR